MIEVGRVLYGSQNLHLDGPDSDRDYKILFCPDFKDLYNNKKITINDLPKYYDKEHVSPIDVRNFDKLAREGNFNIIEMIFSTEFICFSPELSDYIKKAQDLLMNGYLRLKCKNFYNATLGLIHNSFDRYGINHKTVSRAYHLISLLKELPNDNFRVFESTWRNKPYVKEAYRLRFEASLEEVTQVGENLFNSIDDVKNYCFGVADKLIEKDREYTEDLILSSKLLALKMETLVKKVCQL